MPRSRKKGASHGGLCHAGCRGRSLLLSWLSYYVMPGGLTPVPFCTTISSVPESHRRGGHFRTQAVDFELLQRGESYSVLVLNWALIRATVQRYLTHALLVVVIA